MRNRRSRTAKVVVNPHTDHSRPPRILSKQTLVIKPRSYLAGIARSTSGYISTTSIQSECSVRKNMCKENGSWGMTVTGYHYLFRVDEGRPRASSVVRL